MHARHGMVISTYPAAKLAPEIDSDRIMPFIDYGTPLMQEGMWTWHILKISLDMW
jgi:hypothetical protein